MKRSGRQFPREILAVALAVVLVVAVFAVPHLDLGDGLRVGILASDGRQLAT